MSPGISDPNFQAILGPQTGFLLVIFGVIFWTSFWTIFGPLWGPFWGPFWDQIGPEEAKMDPREPPRASKT